MATPLRLAASKTYTTSWGITYLWSGALIVCLHPVWSGPPAMVTLIGCAMLLKGLTRMILPRAALRTYARVVAQGLRPFRLSGLMAMLFGTVTAGFAIFPA